MLAMIGMIAMLAMIATRAGLVRAIVPKAEVFPGKANEPNRSH